MTTVSDKISKSFFVGFHIVELAAIAVGVSALAVLVVYLA